MPNETSAHDTPAHETSADDTPAHDTARGDLRHPDLSPAATRLAELIATIDDRDLGRQTPCPKYVLGDLVEHIGGLAVAFTAAATKEDTGRAGGPPPPGDRTRLAPDWRTSIPGDLHTLAAAWSNPSAWTGMTKAGGIEMPGEICGLVALDELVLHGWDVAATLGEAYECDEASLRICCDLVAQFAGSGSEDSPDDAFGPVVNVAPDAPLLDQLLGLS